MLNLFPIIDCLKGKLADPEEKVRASTCKVVGQLQSRVTDIRNINKHLLETTAERARDKKASVRKAATDAIGAIYNHFFDQLNERSVMDKLGWIPSVLLNGLYSGDLSIT
jgi:sister-chromatid-cohesion protein PDS5